MPASNEEWRSRGLEGQEMVVKEASAKLQAFLHKYGMYRLPSHSDLSIEAKAFYNNSEAVEAYKVCYRERARLRMLRYPDTVREQTNAWQQANRAKVSEWNQEWRHTHRELVAEIDKRYQQSHKAEALERTRKWLDDHPVEASAQSRRYYQKHTAEVIARTTQYVKDHPIKVLEWARNHRASLAGAEGQFTNDEFIALCEAYDYSCFYCGRSLEEVGWLEPDHMTPPLRGGSNYIENIVPACRSCNASKQDKTTQEYLIWLEELNNLKEDSNGTV